MERDQTQIKRIMFSEFNSRGAEGIIRIDLIRNVFFLISMTHMGLDFGETAAHSSGTTPVEDAVCRPSVRQGREE